MNVSIKCVKIPTNFLNIGSVLNNILQICRIYKPK